MDEIKKKSVQDTWKMVEPISEAAADIFYTKLFELDPTVKPMFKSNIKEQGKKLMHMIGLAVRGLDDLDKLVPAVQSLGVRHVAYGVKDRHYDTVGTALLYTLDKGLGKAFTPQVKEAWTETYVTLATVMKEAAAKNV
ncbi:MAG: globin family protein [Candidatus Omnitrophota bacterium]